jgi:hypothetical protein
MLLEADLIAPIGTLLVVSGRGFRTYKDTFHSLVHKWHLPLLINLYDAYSINNITIKVKPEKRCKIAWGTAS